MKSTKLIIARAINGKEAVDYFQNNITADFVLMDINMPIMDGLEATKLIKAAHADIPIIACTAYAMEEEKKRCLEAGCDDYVSKPLQPELLFSIFDKFISMKKDNLNDSVAILESKSETV